VFELLFKQIQEYPVVVKKVDSILKQHLTKKELMSFEKLMDKYMKRKNELLQLEIQQLNQQIKRLTDVLS
jgi:hypothetical protein